MEFCGHQHGDLSSIGMLTVFYPTLEVPGRRGYLVIPAVVGSGLCVCHILPRSGTVVETGRHVLPRSGRVW